MKNHAGSLLFTDIYIISSFLLLWNPSSQIDEKESISLQWIFNPSLLLCYINSSIVQFSVVYINKHLLTSTGAAAKVLPREILLSNIRFPKDSGRSLKYEHSLKRNWIVIEASNLISTYSIFLSVQCSFCKLKSLADFIRRFPYYQP